MVPLYCESSFLWVGLEEWLVKVSWLGKLASVFWWVELDLFSLECNEVSSNDFWDVCGFGVTKYRETCILMIRAVFLPCWRISVSFSGTCWLLGGAWFQCRYGGFWMSCIFG